MILSKSQKIGIALSVIWTVLMLIVCGGMASSSYSGVWGSLLLFVLGTSPVWLYWTGFWIWGNGYLLRAIQFLLVKPLKFLFPNLKKAFSVLIHVIVFFIILGISSQIILFFLKIIGKVIYVIIAGHNTNAEIFEDIENLANILALIFGFIVANKICKKTWPSTKKVKDKKNADLIIDHDGETNA